MQTTSQQPFDPIYMERVNLLTEEATYKLDEVIAALGIRKFSKQGKMLVGTCPIHGGDRPNAFNLYPDGYTCRCYWLCRSKQCHTTFKRNLFGFIRGVLSNEKLGYSGDKTRIYPFKQTVKWLEDFLSRKVDSFKVNLEEIEKKKFMRQVEALKQQPFRETEGWAPHLIKSNMIIPSPYFLKRGFSSDVLRKFDVGESKTNRPNLPMSDRAIAPVYNELGTLIIGFTGRSLYEKCSKCELWHNPSSACKPAAAENCKWRNTFAKENYLYGYWYAREAIQKTKRIVIVEGPGDVWKLWEAGITNCVALLGTVMSDRCQIIIEKSGAEKATVLLDNDQAGELGSEDINRRLKNWLKLRFVTLGGKDPGETSVEELRANLL